MADVDQCTRYAEEGLCGNARRSALRIATIQDSFRNIIFRGKNATQIEKMLDKFSRTIRESVSAKYGFICDSLKASSNDNKDGADLYCINSRTKERIIIEVKFGSYTDKAAGMGSFSQIFGTDIFTKTLSTDTRKQWITLTVNEYPDLSKQAYRSSAALNHAVDIFNAEMSAKNYTLTESEQSFMEDYLLNNSGSYESKADNYMRFETDKNGSKIVEATPVVKGLGEWVVSKVNPINIKDDKSRVNVFVANNETGIEIKFVLNNKNDFKVKGTNIKIRSKYMVNSPSWNVWIRKK
ncbi:MAG: hypothetical protein Q4A25_00700 [Candidatus Saccharibacteria bacterium]|nr:hypothetical protein [Candidatus Saccharibacteria bacterium]